MGRDSQVGKSMMEKKPEMVARSSLRLRNRTISRNRKLESESVEAKTWTVTSESTTKAVEMSSSQACGKESSKLLFVLALGLVPNAKPAEGSPGEGPIVRVERLSRKVDAEARARTKKVIHEICRMRFLACTPRPSSNDPCGKNPLPIRPMPTPLEADGHVPLIDLVSSDEDEQLAAVPKSTVITGIKPSNHRHLHERLRLSGEENRPVNKRKIASSSSSLPETRRPALNPLLSQNTRVCSNREPEFMGRILRSHSKKNGVAAKNDCGKKGLKSISVPFVRPGAGLPATRCHDARLSSENRNLAMLSTTEIKSNGRFDGSVRESISSCVVYESDDVLPDGGANDD